ncbi:hypothetical protein [Rhizomicrobium electricum]|uniref:Right-handed parallel beta-helix repeat-containing protein n=1 Tax=Rhizomicrobium electricum TaxID=480070 RepID=A0ABN1EB46_9PROT|nr:hypothetical protein [Rhizomicrobium electricum]NIJ48128.1 hypothetical protein [Rhizomicrobium electricum]
MPKLRVLLKAASVFVPVSFMFSVIPVTPAAAKILTVGAGQQYTTIAAAASVVRSGDTINVMPGNYGCANFGQYNNFTIQGVGGGVNVSGAVCSSKGLFVFGGKGITVKNISFSGATASDGNGAGIRFQGQNLNVVNCGFRNNQNGILSDYNVFSTVNVTGSVFDHNGTCVSSKGCGHAIYAGHVGVLNVQNSTFTDTQSGHSIKSRANATYVIGNTIKDGQTGTASYLIDVPDGGAVTIAGNTLEKGPKSSNHTAAIAIAEESKSNPAGAILITNNRFQNDTNTNEFIWNQSGHDAIIAGNVLTGNSTKVKTGLGTVTSGRAVVSVLGESGLLPGGESGPATGGDAAQTNVTNVPEPNGIFYLAGGLILLGWILRRKKG